MNRPQNRFRNVRKKPEYIIERVDGRWACPVCDNDARLLKSSFGPAVADGQPTTRVVDLFCGCGGFSSGFAYAAADIGWGLDVVLAVDTDPIALTTFAQNLAPMRADPTPVEELFDGGLGEPPTESELRLVAGIGGIHVLVGGPPCQGNSDLNNHSRRSDVRNALYARMARAAELLLPTVVVIENVPGVRHDASGVVEATADALKSAGYECGERMLDSEILGVPQTRRRHILLAARDGVLNPTRTLDALGAGGVCHVRTVAWATDDLADAGGSRQYDKPSSVSRENARRIAWLFEKGAYDLPNELRPPCHQSDHSYVSMYGRMRSERPAPTITTGFGSMGQGRYVHSTQPRMITPHEAARIQTFPDSFTFDHVTKRRDLAKLIGNAVPPFLARALGRAVLPALRTAAWGTARETWT